MTRPTFSNCGLFCFLNLPVFQLLLVPHHFAFILFPSTWLLRCNSCRKHHRTEETKKKIKPRRNEKGTNNKIGTSMKNHSHGSASVQPNTISHRVPLTELFLLASLRLVWEVSTGVYRRIYRHCGLLTRNGIKSTCRYLICRIIIFWTRPRLCDSFARNAFFYRRFLTANLIWAYINQKKKCTD